MSMTYDPSHRMPPRQERWPAATPAEGWPTYRDADAYRYETDRPAAYPATRHRAGYQRAGGESGDRGYPSPVATDTFPPAGNGYAYQADDFDGVTVGYSRAGNGYSQAADGHSHAGNGHSHAGNGYSHAGDGYGHAADGYDHTGDGYGWGRGGYRQGDEGYADDLDGYDWEPDGYGTVSDGFAAGPNDLGPGSYTEYNEHLSGDPGLTAPDAGVHPHAWQAEQDSRREARQRGMLTAAVTEILGIAVAIGVSTLVAGLIKAQTSPAAAMGSVFIDRTPAALRGALVQHFGAHGRSVLLLGMYAAIAFAALVIGMMARRAAALGVAGIAAFTLVAAFVTITRPGGHVGGVTPAVVGGLAGVAAVLWLVRASAAPQRTAPQRTAPQRHAHGARRKNR